MHIHQLIFSPSIDSTDLIIEKSCKCCNNIHTAEPKTTTCGPVLTDLHIEVAALQRYCNVVLVLYGTMELGAGWLF